MTEDGEQDAGPWWRTRVALAALAWMATAVLASVTVLGLAARWHWALELFTHFTLQYAWGAALLLLAFAATRRRWGVLVAATLLAIHGVAVASVYLDVERVPLMDHEPLRVLVANLNSQNTQRGALLTLIAEERADVVALMEVNSAWMEALEPLAATFPHRVARVREDNFGIALLSRLPLTSANVITLGDADVPSIGARLEFDGHSLQFVLTHPIPPVGGRGSRARDRQLREVAEHVRTLGERTVLVGDFNATPWSPIFREVLATSGMRDSRRGFGVHPTWISRLPSALRIPIDHVLVSPDVGVVERRVGPHIGSDHRPVIVHLR